MPAPFEENGQQVMHKMYYIKVVRRKGQKIADWSRAQKNGNNQVISKLKSMDAFSLWKSERELEGKQSVYLNRLALSDGPRLSDLANNRKIWDNVRDYFPHPYTTAHAYDFIQALSSSETLQYTYAIRQKGEHLCGVIGLHTQSDIYRKSAELGYWVGEPYWNQGIASQAVQQMLDFGFHGLGLVRIFASVFSFNLASARVLEKNGFLLEGIARSAAFKNDCLVDECRYACVK
ncbi:MAG: GNAT family N-acetyltransferase [Haliscomenobacter sp.]